MNNNGFNDMIKIAGLIVPIITALLSFAGIVIKQGGVEELQKLSAGSSNVQTENAGSGSNNDAK